MRLDPQGATPLYHAAYHPSRTTLEAGGEDLGLFEAVPPCQPLIDIITEVSSGDDALGNFTEAPTKDMLLDCLQHSSLFVLDGTTLAHAMAQPLPAVKIVQLDGSGPTALPPTDTPYLTSGTMMVVGCHGNWLDVREWPDEPPVPETTVVTVDCNFLQRDRDNIPATHQWIFGGSINAPCNGTKAISLVSHFTKEAPQNFSDNQFLLHGGVSAHFKNTLAWCWEEQDLVSALNPSASGPSTALGSASPTSEEADIGPVIGIAVTLVVVLGGLGLLVYVATRLLVPRFCSPCRQKAAARGGAFSPGQPPHLAVSGSFRPESSGAVLPSAGQPLTRQAHAPSDSRPYYSSTGTLHELPPPLTGSGSAHAPPAPNHRGTPQQGNGSQHADVSQPTSLWGYLTSEPRTFTSTSHIITAATGTEVAPDHMQRFSPWVGYPGTERFQLRGDTVDSTGASATEDSSGAYFIIPRAKYREAQSISEL